MNRRFNTFTVNSANTLASLATRAANRLKRFSKEERKRQEREAHFRRVEMLLRNRLLVSGGNLRAHGKTAGCLKELIADRQLYLVVQSKDRRNQLTKQYPMFQGRILDGTNEEHLRGHPALYSSEIIVDDVSPDIAVYLSQYVPVVYGFIQLS